MRHKTKEMLLELSGLYDHLQKQTTICPALMSRHWTIVHTDFEYFTVYNKVKNAVTSV